MKKGVLVLIILIIPSVYALDVYDNVCRGFFGTCDNYHEEIDCLNHYQYIEGSAGGGPPGQNEATGIGASWTHCKWVGGNCTTGCPTNPDGTTGICPSQTLPQNGGCKSNNHINVFFMPGTRSLGEEKKCEEKEWSIKLWDYEKEEWYYPTITAGVGVDDFDLIESKLREALGKKGLPIHFVYLCYNDEDKNAVSGAKIREGISKFGNGFIITHSNGDLVLREAVRQGLSMNNFDVISISPLLGGSWYADFARLNPGTLFGTFSRWKELFPAGSYQKELFTPANIEKFNAAVGNYYSYDVFGDPHLSGIWTRKDKWQSWVDIYDLAKGANHITFKTTQPDGRSLHTILLRDLFMLRKIVGIINSRVANSITGMAVLDDSASEEGITNNFALSYDPYDYCFSDSECDLICQGMGCQDECKQQNQDCVESINELSSLNYIIGKLILKGRPVEKQNELINVSLNSKEYIAYSDFDGKFWLDAENGIYSIRIKPDHYLSKAFRNVEIIQGQEYDFGEFYPGDFNNDNKVDVRDIGPLSGSYGCEVEEECYNPATDINRDGIVNIFDIGPFSVSYGRQGVLT